MANQQAYFDEQWYPQLRELGGQIEETTWMHDHIRISREERDLFLENDTENPRFLYQGKSDITRSLEQADELERDIESSKTHALVIDLYKRKIHNHRTRHELIDASQVGDNDRFYKASTQLYGKPKKKYFAYVAERVSELCDDPKVANMEAAKRLRKIVSKIKPAESFTAAVLPPEVPGTTLSDISEVLAIFQATMDRLEITDWQLLVDESGARNRFSVNPFKRIVYIPGPTELFSRAKNLTDVRVRALAEHEVGVHARRAHEAGSTSLQLLQMGLDSYLVGEEGLAGYVQQQTEGATEFYGFDRYLAAGLATGLDGTERDFRGVFGVMCDYYHVRFALDGTPETKRLQAAWDVCMRIFRGTTGTGTGTIYTKDILYLEGNILMWNMITERPDRFEALFIGKFNQFDTRHTTTLQTLEILKEW